MERKMQVISMTKGRIRQDRINGQEIIINKNKNKILSDTSVTYKQIPYIKFHI